MQNKVLLFIINISKKLQHEIYVKTKPWAVYAPGVDNYYETSTHKNWGWSAGADNGKVIFGDVAGSGVLENQ